MQEKEKEQKEEQASSSQVSSIYAVILALRHAPDVEYRIAFRYPFELRSVYIAVSVSQ